MKQLKINSEIISGGFNVFNVIRFKTIASRSCVIIYQLSAVKIIESRPRHQQRQKMCRSLNDRLFLNKTLLESNESVSIIQRQQQLPKPKLQALSVDNRHGTSSYSDKPWNKQQLTNPVQGQSQLHGYLRKQNENKPTYTEIKKLKHLQSLFAVHITGAEPTVNFMENKSVFCVPRVVQ